MKVASTVFIQISFNTEAAKFASVRFTLQAFFVLATCFGKFTFAPTDAQLSFLRFVSVSKLLQVLHVSGTVRHFD